VIRAAAALAAVLAGAGTAIAQAGTVLDEANAVFAKVDDYTVTIAVHETDGSRVRDHVYAYAFRRPSLAKLDIVSGTNKGGGIVWRGGDTVRAHLGGISSSIRRTMGLHDKQVESIRGDSMDSGTMPAILAHFTPATGEISEGAGPVIGEMPTDAVTLKVADPAADKGVTREVLYFSKATHLPVRRESFAGETLVKSETFSNLKTNVGLKDSDFSF